MKCPIDHAELVMTERHGVEIDYCPKCRGVWLDRGELDKIIDKAVPPLAQPEPTPPPREFREPYRPDQGERAREEQREWREPYRKSGKAKRYKKKSRAKSFLEEIFDFD